MDRAWEEMILFQLFVIVLDERANGLGCTDDDTHVEVFVAVEPTKALVIDEQNPV